MKSHAVADEEKNRALKSEDGTLPIVKSKIVRFAETEHWERTGCVRATSWSEISWKRQQSNPLLKNIMRTKPIKTTGCNKYALKNAKQQSFTKTSQPCRNEKTRRKQNIARKLTENPTGGMLLETDRKSNICYKLRLLESRDDLETPPNRSRRFERLQQTGNSFRNSNMSGD